MEEKRKPTIASNKTRLNITLEKEDKERYVAIAKKKRMSLNTLFTNAMAELYPPIDED